MPDDQGSPTPPPAPRKKLADPLPLRASTDVTPAGAPSTTSAKSPSLRDVAMKSSGPIKPQPAPAPSRPLYSDSEVSPGLVSNRDAYRKLEKKGSMTKWRR